MNLREYQQTLLDQTRLALRQHRRVLVQSPTGSGKTALIVHMLTRTRDSGARGIFVVHQRELLAQTCRELWNQNLDHGTIAAGRSTSCFKIKVATIQTLSRRLESEPSPDLLVIDEAHRAAAESYRRAIQTWPKAFVVGLTATPERTDGAGLDHLFNHIVVGPSLRSLVDDGWLSDYTLLAPAVQFDRDSLRIRAGEYRADDLDDQINTRTITGDAVDHYRRHVDGKRCVVMTCSVQHAENVARTYRAAGIPAEHIHGGMNDRQRTSALDRFRSGETKVLTNVQLMVEGVDVPSIECVQWLRPTTSLVVWMQGNGRGMRPSPGKENLIILDHVRNWQLHGLPDESRTWALQGRKERRSRATSQACPLTQCNGCYRVFNPRGHLTCPHCGRLINRPPGRETTLDYVNGELKEIDTAQQRHRRREQGTAQSLDSLIALGQSRGYKNPRGWAHHVWRARQARRA